jgi:hypothetical protein
LLSVLPVRLAAVVERMRPFSTLAVRVYADEVTVDGVGAAGGEHGVGFADDIAAIADEVGVAAVAAARVSLPAPPSSVSLPRPASEAVGTGVAGEPVRIGRADQVLDAGQRVAAGTAGGLRGAHRQADGDAAGAAKA